MYFKTSIAILLAGLSCTNDVAGAKEEVSDSIIAQPAPLPFSIKDIQPPAGYRRSTTTSFGHWLRKLELKKDKTVYLFDGTKKSNQDAQYAVLDIPVGNKDLQQCADAVMRMRAEFLFDQQRYSEIKFTDNEGKQYSFAQPFTRKNLDSYLQKVFSFCGTASLSKQLKQGNWDKLEPGDVLIRAGFPGHAVMVMDIAISEHGNKIYLLAQSYMPAQNIHVLNNPVNTLLSPWYEVNNKEMIYTPEYHFKRTELKSW